MTSRHGPSAEMTRATDLMLAVLVALAVGVPLKSGAADANRVPLQVQEQVHDPLEPKVQEQVHAVVRKEGSVKVGDECDSHEECVTGYCVYHSPLSALWTSPTCAEKVSVGEKCETQSACLSGYCKFPTSFLSMLDGTCADKLADGSTCTEQHECESGSCLKESSDAQHRTCSAAGKCDRSVECQVIGYNCRPLGCKCGKPYEEENSGPSSHCGYMQYCDDYTKICGNSLGA